MDEFKHNPEQIIKSPELIARMDSAIGNCEALIRSLRSSLKESNSDTNVQKSSFMEAYHYASHSVQSLVRSMDDFRLGSSSKIQMSIEIESTASAKDALISFSKLDGIHILTNILNNAAQELVSAQVQNPFIQVRLREINSETIEIRITDNGRGLSPKDFEALTSDVSLFGGHFASVGLHLIRRMIEQRGGKILVETPRTDSVNSGTTVVMRVPGVLATRELQHETRYLDS